MRTAFLRTSLSLAAMLLLAVGCADLPSGPALDAAEFSRSSAAAPAGTVVSTVQRAHPLARDLSVTQVIGPEGGTMQIAQAGVRVSFPAGAVARPTTITMTALRGSAVAVDFTHVASFGAPVTIAFDVRSLAAYSGELIGGHFLHRSDISAKGTARINEVVQVHRSANASEVALNVVHFSGYILSVGRGGDREED